MGSNISITFAVCSSGSV